MSSATKIDLTPKPCAHGLTRSGFLAQAAQQAMRSDYERGQV
jgi:hypothetical protein